jgi:hypothetical protein
MRRILVLVAVLALAGTACQRGGEPERSPTSTAPTSPEPSTTTPGASPSPSATGSVFAARCTLVIGLSQTQNWFEGGAFEALPTIRDEQWEILAEAGADVSVWSDPNARAYSEAPTSACDRPPDRVVFQVVAAGWRSRPVEDQVGDLQASIANIRATWPSVEVIELIPVVGGPDALPCEIPTQVGARTVDASGMNPAMTALIAQVANGQDVLAGPDLLLADCRQYLDGLGHLTQEGSEYIASVIAAYYGA